MQFCELVDECIKLPMFAFADVLDVLSKATGLFEEVAFQLSAGDDLVIRGHAWFVPVCGDRFTAGAGCGRLARTSQRRN
ncbi:hypothetical protein [Actinomadura decatromicini]|uniref:Uncharacterized protein n=1 Tax=Actinomadura decatromicini TaxID=2604572 RepID=A0A5D3FAK4_9ACTN|nr:hypothetical protein [Actinomadura decatromicini]TYK45102.1 hypothetical protein FXF68_30945 [Actinomadura decatromicini]